MAASTAALAEPNAAHTPSPVCLNNQPPWDSMADRSTSSCSARAMRIPSASDSHRRVDPSTSVNRNVTVPLGLPDAIRAVSQTLRVAAVRGPGGPRGSPQVLVEVGDDLGPQVVGLGLGVAGPIVGQEGVAS